MTLLNRDVKFFRVSGAFYQNSKMSKRFTLEFPTELEFKIVMILRRMKLVYDGTVKYVHFNRFDPYPDLGNQRIKESRSRSTTVHEPSPRPNTRPSAYRPTNHKTRTEKKSVLNLETMDTAGLVSTVGTGMSVKINIITSPMTATATVLDQLSLM